MKRYGLAGPISGDLLTYQGKALVHDSRAELEFLFADARVVEIPSGMPVEQTMPVAAHPDLVGVRWPLRREDFRP